MCWHYVLWLCSSFHISSSHYKSTENITITENNKRLQYKTCAYTEAATNIKRLRFQGSYLISPGGRTLKDYPSSEKNAMSQKRNTYEQRLRTSKSSLFMFLQGIHQIRQRVRCKLQPSEQMFKLNSQKYKWTYLCIFYLSLFFYLTKT